MGLADRVRRRGAESLGDAVRKDPLRRGGRGRGRVRNREPVNAGQCLPGLGRQRAQDQAAAQEEDLVAAQDHRHDRRARPQGDVAEAGRDRARRPGLRGEAGLREQAEHGARVDHPRGGLEVGRKRAGAAARWDGNHAADAPQDPAPQRRAGHRAGVAEEHQPRLGGQRHPHQERIHPGTVRQPCRDPATRPAPVGRAWQVRQPLHLQVEPEGERGHPPGPAKQAVGDPGVRGGCAHQARGQLRDPGRIGLGRARHRVRPRRGPGGPAAGTAR